MQETHSDFTNTFLLLEEASLVSSPDPSSLCTTLIDQTVETMHSNCLPVSKVKELLKPSFSRSDAASLLKIVEQFGAGDANPLARYGIEISAVLRDNDVYTQLDRLQSLSQEARDLEVRGKWRGWLEAYRQRLVQDRQDYTGPDYLSARTAVQARSNPRVVPRNHILQRAIDQAELGEFELTRKLLEVFERPFDTPPEEWMRQRAVGEKGASTVT